MIVKNQLGNIYGKNSTKVSCSYSPSKLARFF